MSIDIDMAPFFDSMNTWIPTFLPIFAVGVGIAAAAAIVRMVGSSIIDGIKGRIGM